MNNNPEKRTRAYRAGAEVALSVVLLLTGGCADSAVNIPTPPTIKKDSEPTKQIIQGRSVNTPVPTKQVVVGRGLRVREVAANTPLEASNENQGVEEPNLTYSSANDVNFGMGPARSVGELIERFKKPGSLQRASLERSGFNVNTIRPLIDHTVAFKEFPRLASSFSGKIKDALAWCLSGEMWTVFRKPDGSLKEFKGSFTPNRNAVNIANGVFSADDAMWVLTARKNNVVAGATLRGGLSLSINAPGDEEVVIVRKVCDNKGNCVTTTTVKKPTPIIPTPGETPEETPEATPTSTSTRLAERLVSTCDGITGTEGVVQNELQKAGWIRGVGESMESLIARYNARACLVPTGTPTPRASANPTPTQRVVPVTNVIPVTNIIPVTQIIPVEDRREVTAVATRVVEQTITVPQTREVVNTVVVPVLVTVVVPVTPTLAPLPTPTEAPAQSTSTPTRVPTFPPATETPVLLTFSTPTVAPAQSANTPTRVATFAPATETPARIATPTAAPASGSFPTPTPAGR